MPCLLNQYHGMMVAISAHAAKTKYYGLDGLMNRNLSMTVWEAEMPRIKASAHSVLCQDSSWLVTASISLYHETKESEKGEKRDVRT